MAPGGRESDPKVPTEKKFRIPDMNQERFQETSIVFDCASRRGTDVSATSFNHCGHTPEVLLVLPSRGEGGLPPRPRPFKFDGLVSLHQNALDVRQWAWKKFSVYISSVLMKLPFVHSFASNLLLMAHAEADAFFCQLKCPPRRVCSVRIASGNRCASIQVLEARAVDCRDNFLFAPRREETAWL